MMDFKLKRTSDVILESLDYQRRRSQYKPKAKTDMDRRGMVNEYADIRGNELAGRRNASIGIQNAKQSIVEFGINTVVDEVLSKVKCEQEDYDLAHAVVHNFVNEEGYHSVIRRFKSRNIILSEMGQLMEKYIDEAAKEVSKTAPVKDAKDVIDYSYVINTDAAKNMEKELILVIPDDLVDQATKRISKAATKFADYASDRNAEITAIYADTKDKMKKTDDTAKQEAMEYNAKRCISKINSKPVTLIEAITMSALSNIHKDSNLQEMYIGEDGSIDTKKVIDESLVIYSVMETMNVFNMKSFDESTLTKMLAELSE